MADLNRGYCLVLAGGGAKGVYHLGVWKALRELGIEVDAFVGTSIGAVVAGLLAQDDDTVIVTTDDASTFVPRLFEAAPGAIRSVTIATASLEDAYFQHVRRRGEGGAP